MGSFRRYHSAAVQIDVSALERLQGELAVFPQETSKAVNAALWRLKGSLEPRVRKVVPKYFAISSANMRGAFKNRTIVAARAQKDGGALSFELRGPTLTLARFAHTPTKPFQMTASGGYRYKRYRVKARVHRSSPLKAMEGVRGDDGRLKYPFIMSTGAKSADKIQHNVFIRTGRRSKGSGKEQVRALWSISVPQMVESEKVARELTTNLSELFAARLEHELDYRVYGIKKAVEKK